MDWNSADLGCAVCDRQGYATARLKDRIRMPRDERPQVGDVGLPVIALARLAVAEAGLAQFDVYRAALGRLPYEGLRCSSLSRCSRQELVIAPSFIRSSSVGQSFGWSLGVA